MKFLTRLMHGSGAVVLSVFVASCGGGGGGDSSDGTGSAPSGRVHLNCDVTDSSSGAPVAGARVSYRSGSDEYTTETNANGRCQLDMPANLVAGVKYPAATVTKTAYEPQTIICETLRAGESCDRSVQLHPLLSNISIPVGGDTVMHLGDDKFEGSVNSQFQKASDGIELNFPIADWAEKVKGLGATKATVYLDAKGWQSDVCDNRIGLVGDAGTVMLQGGVSPAEGYWAGGRQVPFVFDIAKIGTQQATLRLVSGTCNDTTDHDDFEINRIRVEFN